MAAGTVAPQQNIGVTFVWSTISENGVSTHVLQTGSYNTHLLYTETWHKNMW